LLELQTFSYLDGVGTPTHERVEKEGNGGCDSSMRRGRNHNFEKLPSKRGLTTLSAGQHLNTTREIENNRVKV
jgi:hypothetical protein